jgi:NitT/TauT family transport system substrate-binding protein
MKRSLFLRAAGSSAVLLPRTAQAQSAVIHAATGPVEEFALPYYAVQKGFFREAGLDVDLTLFNGGGLVTQAVITGTLNIGVTNSGSLSSAHARNLPIAVIGPGGLYSPAAPLAHLVVAPNSPITDAKGLAGKTIGVTTLNDMVQAATMAWIDRHGGDSHAAKFFEMPMVQMGAAIAAGRLDATVIVEPGFSTIKDAVRVIGYPYEAVNDGKPFQTTGAIGNKDWVAQNPELTRRVAAVLVKTANWINANHPEVASLLAQLTKIDRALIDAYPRTVFATKIDPGLVQPVINVMARYGFIPQAFPATELRAAVLA